MPQQLIQPIFIEEGQTGRTPISSMPDCYRLGLDALVPEVKTLADLRIGGILLFGIPKQKDEQGTEAANPNGIVQEAIRQTKRHAPGLVVIGDVCLCEYTRSGHCGILTGAGVDNDATLPLLGKMAVAQADAGADIVAPSAMMDHQVHAIRTALDEHDHQETSILSYAAKFASALYGPFREAAASAPQSGDRSTYQMNPANSREALREVELDIQEGADAILVKPGLASLDIIRQARDNHALPIGAYQVSGEYAMIKAAAEKGWIDEPRALVESLYAMRRAGADFIVTYFARKFGEIFSSKVTQP